MIQIKWFFHNKIHWVFDFFLLQKIKKYNSLIQSVSIILHENGCLLNDSLAPSLIDCHNISTHL